MPQEWYETTYRRSALDMHIPDWNESFLSELDPVKYVEMLVRARVQSAVVFAHSHAGLCLYPTSIGRMHAALKDRDTLREIIELCHNNDIAVVVYYSTIFDRYAYDNNPDWRILTPDGTPAAEGGRHGLCCPNSPYRDYAASLAAEICENYEFEGMRFDMTFWPAPCYCRHCRARFAAEGGEELPRVIDWQDPHWVSFQRKREQWLADFAALLTSTVKRLKPGVSVEHQASTYPLPWQYGVTHQLAQQNDFLQGDFYGDALQGSFARKLFCNLSAHLPYCFEISASVDLENPLTIKSPELLETKVCAALADGGAFLFIDQIDPVGTLRPLVYERMGKIFERTREYERHLGGELCQDVGIYFSTISKCDFSDNGKKVEDGDTCSKMPHVEAALSAAQSLIEHHLPFGVIARCNLDDLSRHQVIVLANVLMMDTEEVDALREYVRSGGSIYASKYTSLVTSSGHRQADFMLADVFGVSYNGETQEKYTYVAPTTAAGTMFGEYSAQYPIGLSGGQMLVAAHTGAEVLGSIGLPYTDPADPHCFASIHNNPPGVATDHPAVIFNQFGQGKSIYVTGDLESSPWHRSYFINLIRLAAGTFTFEGEAPKSIEITVFHQPDRRRFLISLVNFPKDLPSVPVEGIRVRLQLDGKSPERLLILPAEETLAYETWEDYVEFTTPQVATFLMLALDYS